MEDQLKALFPNIDLTLLNGTENDISVGGKISGSFDISILGRHLHSWYEKPAALVWRGKDELTFHYDEENCTGESLRFKESGYFHLSHFPTIDVLKVRLNSLLRICLMMQEEQEQFLNKCRCSCHGRD